MSCSPVPGVIWKRTDNKPISVRAQRRSYGLELYFASIEYEDEGSYECSGYNEAEPLPARVNVSAWIGSMSGVAGCNHCVLLHK